jgi:hypothetical protein
MSPFAVVLADWVSGADADAEHGAGDAFQVAVRCIGQAARPVTGVNADDEHYEDDDYRAGQDCGDNESHDGRSH